MSDETNSGLNDGRESLPLGFVPHAGEPVISANELKKYRVGNARLVFGEVAFEPGAPFTDLGLLTPQQLQTFFDSGHLIRIEESA